MTKVQIKMPDYVLFGGKTPPAGGIVWVETGEYYTLEVLRELKKLQEQVATLSAEYPKKRLDSDNAQTEALVDEA